MDERLSFDGTPNRYDIDDIKIMVQGLLELCHRRNLRKRSR